jgi:PBSX family phage terminase large subunit
MEIHNLLPFGAKALESMNNTGFLTVWEGSVRSMKTVTSLKAFIDYVLSYPVNNSRFIMTGATQGSLYRNCIENEFGIIALSGGLFAEKVDKNNAKYLQLLGTQKKVYYFGGDNVASYKPIRGATYAGWYADEINNHHKNTIIECFNRTAVSLDRRNFWTLNPDAPSHWIYTDFIDKFLADKIPGYRWFHFTLDDNPAITAERKVELERQYTGVFYQRYILGRRVRAEGSIYTSFDRDKHIIRENPNDVLFAIIGADIGGNKSATSYVVTGFFWKDGKLAIAALDELYDKENISTEHILKNFKVFAEKQKALYTIQDGYVDSAEQLILKSMRNIGVLNVHGSKKIKIVDRIRLLDYLFACDRAFIHKRCKHLIDAVENAVWDPKGMKEERLDDGTSNVDSLDSFEYSFEGKYRELMV